MIWAVWAVGLGYALAQERAQFRRLWHEWRELKGGE